jgi:hypothetical protein
MDRLGPRRDIARLALAQAGRGPVKMTMQTALTDERTRRAVHGAAPVWLMLFEGRNAPAGDVPRMASPATTNGSFRRRLVSPRELGGGVRRAASATPPAYSPAPGSSLFVEAERLP